MKKLLIIIFLLNWSFTSLGQHFQLHIIGKNDLETKTIDSLNYQSKHLSLKSLENEITNIAEALNKKGYIENEILDQKLQNDSVYLTKMNLGYKIKWVHIDIGQKSEFASLLKITSDSVFIKYEETETYLNTCIQKLEKQGYAFAKIKLIDFQNKKGILSANLEFDSNKKRILNSIVIKTKDKDVKFPKGILEQINKKYKNKTFNKEYLKLIKEDFDSFGFSAQLKYPEILFTKDTTKVYVYLEKRKSNTFDGFIGFSNNENQKLSLNGYVDGMLENTVGIGEQFSIYWKSDGNKQKTFKTNIEIPYILKTPISLKAQINIFKQDSTFQNTKTAVDLGYFLNFNSKIYLGYQSTVSTVVQNSNIQKIEGFKNTFTTVNFEYSKKDNFNDFFPFQSKITFSIGTGNRSDPINVEKKAKQLYFNLQLLHTFYINNKNSISIRSQNYYLQSDSYLTNELLRFGGINSIRGYDENSLQTNQVSLLLTEYRYAVSPTLYLHTVLDFGLYQDKTNELKKTATEQLFSAGIGLGLQTKSGLFKFALVNGGTENQKNNFYNSMIQISYNVKF